MNKRNAFADRESLSRLARGITVLLAAAAVILGILCLALMLRYKWVRIEAGQPLTAAELAGEDGARFGPDFDSEMLRRAGVYYFTVITDRKEIKVRLRVTDTKAPAVSVKNIKCAVGGEYPTPMDFIDHVDEPDGFTGEFVTPLPEIKAMGTYPAQIRFTDASGNRTAVFDVAVTIVVDNEGPEISAPDEITVTEGQTVDYSTLITLRDNCVGKTSFEVDESEADLSKAGKYRVTVTAEDGVGNRARREIVLRVVEAEESETVPEG